MTSEQLIEKFLKVEYKNQFFKLRMQNVLFWHYIRFDIYSYLMEFYQLRNNNVERTEQLEQRKGIKDFFEKKVKYNPAFSIHKDLIFFAHPRKIQEKEFYKCVYTHLLSQKTKYSNYVFDKKLLNDFYYPQDVKRLKYIDEKKYKMDTNFRADKRLLEEKIIKVLEREFQIAIPREIKLKCLLSLSHILQVRTGIISYDCWILKKVKPKAIVLVVAYSLECMLLCEAGKIMNIPVIELQHGVIGKEHIAYNFYKPYKLKSFPDYIFTFGNYDKKCARLPITKNRVYAVGYPELEKSVKKYTKFKKNNEKRVILILSQTLPILAEYASYLAEHTDTEQYEIVFKLHPREYDVWERELGNYLNSPKIKVVGNTKRDIYYYLARADYVVSNSSTALIEATMFDVNVIVVKEGAYTYMKMLYENGYAQLAESKNHLLQIVKTEYISQNRRDFFEKNSIEKFDAAIKEIIKE